MKILAIETSCDETAAAVVIGDQEKQSVQIASTVVSSSMKLHSKTGGIIPEVAAREQIKYMLPAIDTALNNARSTPSAIDAIAVTIGPGLIGSLLIGVETAKTLSFVWDKPLIPVNHLLGHMYANWINKESSIPVPHFPSLCLIVSGGHTDLVLIKDHRHIQWISGTRDDAAGEAFDKIGRLLHLSYPAGPIIEKFALMGNAKTYRLPRPLLYEKTFDFSFSGLKTAVLREVEKLEKSYSLTKERICDLARATQDAIIEVLVEKTMNAVEQFGVQTLLLGGGVAANQTLVEQFKIRCAENGIHFFSPPKFLCTDNAAMIGAAAFFHRTFSPWRNVNANPELYFD